MGLAPPEAALDDGTGARVATKPDPRPELASWSYWSGSWNAAVLTALGPRAATLTALFDAGTRAPTMEGATRRLAALCMVAVRCFRRVKSALARAALRTRHPGG